MMTMAKLPIGISAQKFNHTEVRALKQVNRAMSCIALDRVPFISEDCVATTGPADVIKRSRDWLHETNCN